MALGYSRFDERESALELKNLIQIGPIEKISQLTADREGPFLQATMTFVERGGSLKILGGTAQAGDQLNIGFKPQPNICFNLGLMAFGKPEVVTASRNDLYRNSSLGVEGISNDHLAPQIEALQ